MALSLTDWLMVIHGCARTPRALNKLTGCPVSRDVLLSHFELVRFAACLGLSALRFVVLPARSWRRLG